jgi:hypothetical protein
MTKRAVCTEVQVRRNIQAALRCGLRVTAIRPDRWVILRDGADLVSAPAPALDDHDALPPNGVTWRRAGRLSLPETGPRSVRCHAVLHKTPRRGPAAAVKASNAAKLAALASAERIRQQQIEVARDTLRATGDNAAV